MQQRGPNRVLSVLVGVLIAIGLHTSLTTRFRPAPEPQPQTYQEILAEFIKHNGETTGVVDRSGVVVGYITAADYMGDPFAHPSGVPHEDNPPLPVWSYESGELVGHMIPDLGFVALEDQP